MLDLITLSCALRLPFSPSDAVAPLAAAAIASAALLSPPPALAVVSPTEAITEAAVSAHPVLRSLSPVYFPGFVDKVADVLIDVPNSRPGALFKAVDTGLDALLTVPKDKLGAAAIEEAFSGLDTSTCDLVPLPSPELFSKFKDTEVAKVDAAKLKAAVDVLKETTKSVKRTDTGVCLPSPEALTKIALIQTEASAAVDPAAAAKFAAEAKKLGGAVNPRNVLPLVPYVEPGGLLPRSFPADQLARFKKAGFALEAAQKQALKAQKGGGLSGMAVRGAPAS